MFRLTQLFQMLAFALKVTKRLFVPATAVVVTDELGIVLTPCD